ncbi:MAG: argininosuccinate lyase [Candidatus Bathyarchaeia archaeon]
MSNDTPDDSFFGRSDILPPTKSVQRRINLPRIKREVKYLHHMIWINEAYLLMLQEQGIISENDAKLIAQALEKLMKERLSVLKIDLPLDDLYIHIEKFLIEEIGPEIGGKLHVGRSRWDLYATFHRMIIRDKINVLTTHLLDLQNTLIELALFHSNTIIVIYTHFQHAQPTTFGHYLLAIVDSLFRDLERIEMAYKHTNLCPLGGSIATSSFPINRVKTCKLLGFDDIIENSYDAATATDYLIETVWCLCSIIANLNKLINDIHLWQGQDINLIKVAGQYATSSSMMPQKRNPIVLENIRARGIRIYGNLISILCMLKNLNSPCRDEREVIPLVFDSFKACNDVIIILDEIMKTLEVNSLKGIELARDGFSTMSQLAEYIVRFSDIKSFRVAHKIVGRIVSTALERKMKPSEITSRIVDEVSEKIVGKRLGLKEDIIKKALDPKQFVLSRKVKGGPSPKEVQRMVRERKELLKNWGKKLMDRKGRLKKAYVELRNIIKKWTTLYDN